MSALDGANRAQRAAADPGANVFVTANAGSGKTKVLIDRIARLLLAGADPSAFLCITYTKAAAAEMQRRLFQRLGAWCVADDAALARDLAQLEGRDEAAAAPGALSTARALFARALETPGGLKIETIHAFCQRLLTRFPLEAGVAPGFELADEAAQRALLARAWDLADLERAHGAAFTRFTARLHAEAVEALFAALTTQRAALHTYAQAHGSAEKLRQAVFERHGARRAPEAVRGAFFGAFEAAALSRLAAALCASSPADAKKGNSLGAAIDLLHREGENAAAFDALSTVMLTTDGAIYAKLITAPFEKKYPGEAALARRLAEASAAALGELRAWERAEDTSATLEIAAALNQAYSAAKRSAGALDFDDLISAALRLLTAADSAPWVLYKLDGGLSHILIDEGQDTSPAQWDLAAPLWGEFLAGAGARHGVRTTFAVGDPKQSIYSFQGAEPRRFAGEAQRLEQAARAAGAQFTAPSLTVSFRTTQVVLQAVDAVMNAAGAVTGEPEASNIIHHESAREREEGFVEVWPVAPRPEKQEAHAWDAPLDVESEAGAASVLARGLAQRVRQWIEKGEAVWDGGRKRAMEAGDVMVLVRTRGPLFRALLRAFKQARLPVAGADRMTLGEEMAVMDCLALMRVAIDPGDDLSLACVLKGPWCGLDDDDADIFPLAHGRSEGESLFSRLMAQTETRFHGAQRLVQEAVLREAEAPFAFLSWALEHADDEGRSGWKRVLSRLGAEARDPLEALAARALDGPSHGADTLVRFIAAIAKDEQPLKREMEAAGDAVRIMTVHGAKGLEAPVVLLPDTTSGLKPRSTAGLFFDDGAPFYSASAKEDDAACAAARTAAQQRDAEEDRRLLYVAMTRARDRLLICGAAHGNGAEGVAQRSWHGLISAALAPVARSIDTPFGPGLALGAMLGPAARSERSASIPALPDWTQRAAPGERSARIAPSKARGAPRLSPRRAGLVRLTRGRLLHGLLQRLPDVAEGARREAALAWLARQGAENPEALTKEALRVLAEPAFAPVFGPGSRAEVPLVGLVGRLKVSGVVDRLIVRDQDVMIIDFKSDRPAALTADETAEGYVAQMALYQALIQQIFPGREVRCALVWTEKPALTALPAPLLAAALARLQAG